MTSTGSLFTKAYQTGEAKRRAGQFAEARKDFEAALACAATGPEKADALLGIGNSYVAWALAHRYEAWTPPTSSVGKVFQEKQRQFEAARGAFEKVLGIPDITPDQRAEAHYHLATVYQADYEGGEQRFAGAQAELQKIMAIDGVSLEWRVKAQMRVAHYIRYGSRADPIEAYAKVLTLPGISPAQRAEVHLAVVGILLEKRQRADAHVGVVGTLLDKKDRSDAHQELAKIFSIADLPPASLALARLALGKTFFLEANYGAARNALAQALDTAGLSGPDKVEVQLHIGLSDYYEGKDYERAGRELRKVLEMPDATYGQIHEATLRLRLRKLLPADEKVITVLFIGSSHTQVRNVPQMVERLAASAPAGRPRIIATQSTFGGHTVQKLWALGDGPGTPRAAIAQNPWDYLVMERTSPIEWVTLFNDLARGRNIQPILYETPVSATVPYPDGFKQSREESVAIGRRLNMPLAPAAYAWMLYLGPEPSTADRLALYHADGVHTGVKGAYLVACTIYATLTGCSPVGLAHDMPSLAWTDGTGELTDDEALALQTSAWNAYRQTQTGR